MVEYVVILAVLSLATTLGLTSVGENANSTISTAEEGFGQEVVFETEDGVLQRGFYNSYQPIVIPEAPEVEDSTFEGWTLDGQNIVEEDDIRAAMNAQEGALMLRPVYRVNVTNIIINPEEITLEVGCTENITTDLETDEVDDINKFSPIQKIGDDTSITLNAFVDPVEAAYKTVVWSSSDHNIATVDEYGKVTAVSVGTAVITATATNGTEDPADDKIANCVVTVINSDNGSIEHLGLSLRRRVYKGTRTTIDFETDLRFGFSFDLPEGAVVDTDKSYYRWKNNSAATADTGNKVIFKSVDTSGEKPIANLVITGIPKAYYQTDIYCFVHLTYILDGEEYILEAGEDTRGAFVGNVLDTCKQMERCEIDLWADYAKLLLGKMDADTYNSLYK